MTFREFCEREIVCVEDGRRLGHPCDLEFSPDGEICAVLAAAPCDSMKKLFCRPDEYKILWRQICRLGDDLILVNGYCPVVTAKCKK